MLYKLLKARYPLPEWALVFELNKGVGFSGTDGRADAVAFNCYPSKKLVRHAFEMKISRGDFIRELNNPLKRKWLEDNFHETYFVTTHGIAKDNEIPEGWGLLTATKNGESLRRTVIAKHRDITSLPERIALSAIRSLAQSLSNLDLPYAIAGQEVQKEDVEKWAREVLDHQHKTLKDGLNAVRKERQALSDIKDKLTGPFSELREAMGRFGWSERRRMNENPTEVITVDNVREWIAAVIVEQSKRILEDAIHARDSLSQMIARAQNEPRSEEQ